MIFDKKDDVKTRKDRLLNILALNNEEGILGLVKAMGDDEFALLNIAANDLLDRRITDADEFAKQVVKLMVQEEADRTLLRPLALLRVADGVRGSLVLNGYSTDEPDLQQQALNMEFYRCILDVVEPSRAHTSSIAMPNKMS